MKPAKATAKGDERSKKKRADREAETLRSVATLAAAVSHEINNPLMAVMINLELLERTHRLDAYGRERLEAALAAADEIKEKVRRFGLISRLELASDGPYLPQMLDLEKSSQGLDPDERLRRRA
jgi:signal transduction histidine kinase